MISRATTGGGEVTATIFPPIPCGKLSGRIGLGHGGDWPLESVPGAIMANRVEAAAICSVRQRRPAPLW